MSTIASPRPSISSRRTSASTDTTTTTSHAQAVERGSQRRNRAALRDYYNLASSVPADARSTPPAPSLDVERESELDRAGFDASAYVTSLLAKEKLEDVLQVEAGLVSEIRGFDGEKKALVYDNYSKLIAATDTIRRMRERMDPMTPTTSTLEQSIGRIAETAAELRNVQAGDGLHDDVARKRREQQATVKWILAAPERLTGMVEKDERQEAEDEWTEISGLLDKWRNVKGVQEVRSACLNALSGREGG